MPRGKFRLQALLSLRRQEAEEQLRRVTLCIRELEEQRDRIKETEQEYNSVIGGFRTQEQLGASIADLMIHRRYLDKLRGLLQEQGRIAEAMSQDLDVVRRDVDEALARCRSVEMLKNKHDEAETQRIESSELKLVDDLNMTRFARDVQTDSA